MFCLAPFSHNTSVTDGQTTGNRAMSSSTIADIHGLAVYDNKHCWRAFQGYQHRWP